MRENNLLPTSLPQVVIGLGTGRCGTQSLATLLDQQTAAMVSHEKAEHEIRWNGSEQAIDQFLDWAVAQEQLQFVGDVAFYYLPYVEYILARQPSVKFICLQRNCADTIASYMQKTPDRNHWIDHQGVGWQKSRWDGCYPKYTVPDKQSALTLYWYDYYFTATRLQALYPNDFRIFPMTALNSKAGQQAICGFLGMQEAYIRFAVGLRVNTYRYEQWQKLRIEIQSRAHAIYRLLNLNWMTK